MNDDDPLAPLRRAQPLPPSKVDITRALRDGRRRRRNRRVLAVATAAIAVGAMLIGVSAFALDRRPAPPADETPPPSVAPSRNGCAVHRLPTPGPGTVVAVDPAGGYAVGALDGTPTDGLLVWASGVLQVTTGAPENAYPAAVNASGIVVGNAPTSPPWMLKNRVFTPLAVPPDAQSVVVNGINTAGDIIGTASWDSNGRTTRARIVRWNATRPDQVAYVTDTPAVARAAAVGDDGTIVGNGDGRAYVWSPDGTGHSLQSSASVATQIAGDWAIGSYEEPGSWFDHGVLWKLSTGEAFTLAAFVPGAVDRSGRMFGVLMHEERREYSSPALWKDEHAVDMPVLSEGQSAVVTSMTADGRMAVGWLFRSKNDAVIPVRWNCA